MNTIKNNELNKITKKKGQEILLNNIVRLASVCNKSDIEKAKAIIDNTTTETYESVKQNSRLRKAIKSSSTQMVFEILEGDKKGEKSWLTSLTGTNWFTYTTNLGSFILIENNQDKDFVLTMIYEIVK